MEVRLLGVLEAEGEDGTPLSVQGAKARALLAVLALDAGRVVPTDRLIDALWQDDPPAGVNNSLQGLVSKLRKSLGADRVVMQPPGYLLAIEPGAVDAHRVDRLVGAARTSVERGDLDAAVQHFSEAEALWRGPPLADFAYDEFAQPHIARLSEVRLALTEERVDAELALGRHQRLVGDLEVLVAAHPVRERLRGQLMVALYRAGRQADALRVFQEGRAVLAEELGLDPGPELRQLEAAILAQDPSLDAPAVAPPSAGVAPARRRTNLRAARTPLVGRQRELDELDGLRAAHRLVTVVGPGGAGKTRLVTELAHRALETSDLDVVLVELAAVGDPAAVPTAIATAFELRDPEVDPLARVAELAQGRRLLLVLDNCEHLVDAAAAAADDLLQGSESLRILATSREALRIPGEVVWVVPPLGSGDGVALFVERAAAHTGVTPGDVDLRAIGDICARLDGLPLAIELAAARTRAFTVTQIAERLDDRFRLLSGGSRTAMARQQTLRAVVDWSYDLLFDDERRVFERLAVFPGGCTLDAAEAVCAVGDLDAAEVAEYVAALVDKSLLVVDRTGPLARYGMLQTLSQYGRERLVERGDADAAFGAMTAHLAALCQRGRDAWRGVDQREWFRAVDAEQDNLRTAYEWALGAGEKELAVGLAADLGYDRWIAGGSAEGLRWLDEALALPGDLEPFTDGWSRMWRAFLAFITGDRDRSDEQFDEAIALLRAHADPVFVAYALSFYAQLVDATGRRPKATELNHQLLDALASSADPWARPATAWVNAALAIQEHGDFDAFEAGLQSAGERYAEVGDSFMAAVCRDLVAELAESRGDLDRAITALTAALEIVSGWRMRSFEAALVARRARAAVQRGDDGAEALVADALGRSDDLVFRPGRAMALNALAELRRQEGRLDEAEAAAQEALDLYRAAPELRFSSSFSRAPTPFDVPVGAASALSVLGFVAEHRGDTAEAAERHRGAFDHVAALLHPRTMARSLEGLAACALASGDAERAARLLGCSGHLRRTFDAGATPVERADIERVEQAASEELGRDAYEVAGRDGAGTAPSDLVRG